jgi:hypothetical protein
MIAALLLAAAGADLPDTSEMNVLFRSGPTGGTVPVNCWSFLPLRSIFSIRPVLIRVIPLMRHGAVVVLVDMDRAGN